ncbi:MULTISPECIES: ABC-F family ATP-binding cassette domain-containing protein [Microbacterium]|uniref:ATP-binding cassette domain-containing protein n=2 Tax=Microbacterium maritypicum TaxID=33918 RepID=A0ACD4B9E5_MICMQ|nr:MULTISPECIES: ATP-binding cassette domain-containing protein [Microbacterium]EYT58275.1 ABC transporter [Microbacterium sp. UCD-TDU]UTT53999.1 ATP-binding cassette domain-containing protein [Microbacterium liquefaciens]WEF21960.1 ATP-binding cassette domain-containing protein [Microbacterium liquefaciens]
MGSIDVSSVSLTLPDGRPLLDEASFRVGAGSTSALIGPNGAGKTTMLRIIRGDQAADDGVVTIDGGLGVMDQFVGHGEAGETVHQLLVRVAPARIRGAAEALESAENALIERDEHDTQMAYASAIAEYADAGGYEHETVWDQCTIAALGVPYERARYRELTTLSGGEQKRLALEALLRGPDEVLLLDEPDNYLDVPTKRWLEEQLRQTSKTVLLVSHDRELLARAADRLITLEPGGAGATAWVHGGGFGTYQQARTDRMDRLDELRRRWDEQHEKLRTLVANLKVKASANDGFASRYQAAQTRLRKFEEVGPPEERPPAQEFDMRLRGARTGKRAVVAQRLELTGLMRPFDTEVWYGDRVAVLGSNGSGKSHFLRLLARGGSDPDSTLGHVTSTGEQLGPVEHTGTATLGARVVPGLFAQTHAHPEFVGRTLLEILHRGDDRRAGMPRDAASSALDRYGLVRQAQQTFDSLSGGQQARFQVLLLELSGATLLLLDEPTDNLDLESAEALEQALARFAGTVLAVTHDRWFARSFDRFLVFGGDGEVYESDEPVWDEKRVTRTR